MSEVEHQDIADPGAYRPDITDRQRRVLDELHRVYLDVGDWPTHAYLEQVLDEQDIDLDDELRGMPERIFYPDNRRMGGVLHFQEEEKVGFLVRGLVACSDAELEVRMFVATIKWAVAERRAVRQNPTAVTAKTWRAADAMRAMGDALGLISDLPAFRMKLVLEVLRMEPNPDLPRWGGIPENFPNWHLDIPSGVKRFRGVETIADYLKETDPKLQPTIRARSRVRLGPEMDIESPSNIHPVFGHIAPREDCFDCFVLLPLREPFRTIYRETVEPVARELGMSCGHAEGIFGPGRIMEDVLSSITYAKVIVAELTGRNPNVFYELGIAHQLGKQVILMTQEIEDVPFDVRDRRVVVYEWSADAPDADDVIGQLRPHFEGALRAARA